VHSFIVSINSRYYEKFFLIVEAFRRESNSTDIPLIVGGLGDYLNSGAMVPILRNIR
jgi:hypothetical protein